MKPGGKSTAKIRAVEFLTCGENSLCENQRTMDEPKQKYKWPWFAAAAVVLFIVIAVLAVALQAKKVAQQRDFNAPLPSSAPAR
ncbi:MAG TPA: hypothetical protein VGI63_06105 [Verrucomicrobiae bacterium]|jgi:hypothetical protein